MQEIAKEFTNAIKTLTERPQALENLQLYLEHHFSTWLKKYANTPESITAELKAFSKIEF